MLQQNCPGLTHKAAIGALIAVKRLQKLDEALRIVRELLTRQRKEKW
ncbi:hypothetical protein [Blastomonas sp. SL216]|nr:hypothetical protein OU999_04075 [Blastomonas sp. SL216]